LKSTNLKNLLKSLFLPKLLIPIPEALKYLKTLKNRSYPSKKTEKLKNNDFYKFRNMLLNKQSSINLASAINIRLLRS
jgi:hypothetical protein